MAGLLFHPSALWLVAFVAAIALYFTVQALMDLRISARNSEAAGSDFLNTGTGFILKRIEDTTFLQEKDYPHIFDNRKRLREISVLAPLVSESLKDNPWMWEGHPLQVFVATSSLSGLV